MASLIAKRIVASCFVYPSRHYHHHHHHHHLAPLTPSLLRFLSTQHQKSTEEIPFIAQYLISSFGFSRDRALKFSTKNLISVTSSDRPELLVTFLKETGLSDTQIKAVVYFDPNLLRYNVENTLKPRVHKLINAGFSGELLVQLIRYNPAILTRKDTLSLPCLLFWRDFVGKGNNGLLKIIRKNPLLFALNIDKQIAPRINLLKEYGFSNQDIVSSLMDGSRCMTLSLNSLREKLELIEELGLPRGSRLYWRALRVVTSLSKETMKRKMEFLKTTCRWSEKEISSAFKKFPSLLSISEEKVKVTMVFLIENVGMEPESIASSPVLFGYSLKRRLMPRHHVLSILAAKGLKKNCSFPSVCCYAEEIFLQKFVEPYEKDVPELTEAYFAASGGNISV